MTTPPPGNSPQHSVSQGDRDPEAIFRHLVFGVAAGTFAELPDLYAEDAHVEHPFHPLAEPALVGRSSLREHFNAAAEAPHLPRTVENIHVHQTSDPEVIVAEFVYRFTKVDKATVDVPCVFILRVRDGEIVESRDYIHHLASAHARGMLPDLLQSIAHHWTAAGEG
jgi:uncharacterized protein